VCGTLKHEKRAIKLGQLVDVYAPLTGRLGRCAWSGHARREKLDSYWYQNDCVPVHLHVSSFVEQGWELWVPTGIIEGIGLKKDIWVGSNLIGTAKSVKIVTRPPLNEFEKKIHHRWPLVLTDNGPQSFTVKDIRS